MSLTSKARRDRRKIKTARAERQRATRRHGPSDGELVSVEEGTARLTITRDGNWARFRFEQLSDSGPGLDFRDLSDLMQALGIPLDAQAFPDPMDRIGDQGREGAQP